MDMDALFNGFLSKFRVKSGEPFTHTTKKPKGAYFVDHEHNDTFFEQYCDAVKNGIVLSLTEYPGKFTPLRVDMDFKWSIDEGTQRKYTTEDLHKIVSFYQSQIKEIVDPVYFEPKMMYCIVLEKRTPRRDENNSDLMKDGFHLHFPYFICANNTFEYIRNNFVNRIEGKKVNADQRIKIFEDVKFTQRYDQIVDADIGRKTWMMYGSANIKGKYSEPYLITKCYDDETNLVNIEKIFEEDIAGIEDDFTYHLPRLLSIKGYQEEVPLVNEVQKVCSPKPRKNKAHIQHKRSEEEVCEDLKTIENGGIMAMLSDERAGDYRTWLDVGWTLFNIGEGHEDAFKMWEDFSRRAPDKYIEGDCEDRWARMELRNKGMGSLLAMARADSPDDYNKWKSSNVDYWVAQSLKEHKPNEYDLSMVVTTMYKHKFLCVDDKKDIWYQFDQYWKLMDNGNTLRKKLATEVAMKFRDYINKNSHRTVTNEDNAAQNEIKKCLAIITALKTCCFQDKVLRMCKLQMYDKKFFEKSDENKMLWGCENGVLDLELCIFREGRPDDNITYSCGHCYKPYEEDSEEIKDIDEYFRKVFVNANIREYFLNSMALCMQGGNLLKRFYVATGGADGGKSTTFSLMEMVFGDYCNKFPRDLFLMGRGHSSGAARPELARVKGRRICIGQEIAKTETLNIGIIRDLTGNDSFYARTLFEKGTEIKPMFTLWMQTNEPPKIPGQDYPTWRRIRVIPFESKFVIAAEAFNFPIPETEEEQIAQKRFPADLEFSRKMPDLAPVLLWMLFERFKSIKGKQITEPDEVKAATEEYRSDNDVFMQFILERIEEDDNEEAYIKLGDVYQLFKEWYKENHPSYNKGVGRMTLKLELIKRLGTEPDDKGRWYGYRLTCDNDDDEINALGN